MSKEKSNTAVLDGLFEEAVNNAPKPSDRLMNCVLADALNNQPNDVELPIRMENSEAPGIFPQLFNALGRWPAAAGLATATIVGMWIGAYPTDLVADMIAQYLGHDSDLYLVDLANSIQPLMEEG